MNIFVAVTENTYGGFGVPKHFVGYHLQHTGTRTEALAIAEYIGGFVHEMSQEEYDAVDDKYRVNNVPGRRIYG